MSVDETQVLDAPDGSRPFDAAAIESDLKNMWKRVGKSDAPGPAAIYRAALANLVVPLDPALGLKLMPVLVEVTRRHPARLFSIGAGAAERGARLLARIGAVCHRRDVGGGLVCSEQVVVDSDMESTPLIPSAIRSLIIGDLPTVLLDFHPSPDRPWIAELMDMADIILVDSCLKEPGKEPEVWRFLRDQGSARVRDLAWTRLVPWRAILAEAFDEKEAFPALGTIRSVEIGFTGQGYPPPSVWLLAGWLASRLGWTLEGKDRNGLTLRSATGPVTMTLTGSGTGEGRVIERVRIRSGEPHILDMEILHRGRELTAHKKVRAPGASSADVPFGYLEFAACIVGEINRHAANPPLEAAASAAEAMMRQWNLT
jgi:glucose-6-phosphate dehydrogenase assembly protein OpcA